MEWGAVLIPLLAAAYAYKFHRNQVVWWEFLISIVIPVAAIFILKFTAQRSLATDTEYWTGYMVSCSYEEPWDEYIHQTCTRTVGSGDDQRTETYDCSYVDNHPAKWHAADSNGIVFGISQDTYESIASRWGGSQRIEMNRPFHRQDGEKYVSEWNKDARTIEVVTTIHSYENRVQVSGTVLDFVDVDPKKYGLYEYPKLGGDGYDCPSILGNCPRHASANFTLNAANAALGARKQVRMWMLIFDGKPIEAAIEQESYWKGGNKNELVTCVGTKDGKVTWCYVFSWTPKEEIKISVRDRIASMSSFDADQAVRTVVEEVDAKWERKQFSEFAYLSVPIDTKWMIIIYLVTFLITVGVFAFSVNNSIDEDSGRYWPSNRRRW